MRDVMLSRPGDEPSTNGAPISPTNWRHAAFDDSGSRRPKGLSGDRCFRKHALFRGDPSSSHEVDVFQFVGDIGAPFCRRLVARPEKSITSRMNRGGVDFPAPARL